MDGQPSMSRSDAAPDETNQPTEKSMSIDRNELTKAPRAWGAALNELHIKQMAVAEAERVAASHLAALEAGRKEVEVLLSNWAEAEARAEAARQALKA